MIAPRPVTVKLSQAEIESYRPIADAQEQRNGYFRGATDFRRGLTDSPTLRGMIGEDAFCKWVNRKFPELKLQMDVSCKPCGDGGVDFSIFKVAIQIKTRSEHLRGKCLIRRLNDAGDILPINWHVMVSATIPRELAGRGILAVTLDGWIFRDRLPENSIHDAMRGNHKNIVVLDAELESTTDLCSYLEGRKNAILPS